MKSLPSTIWQGTLNTYLLIFLNKDGSHIANVAHTTNMLLYRHKEPNFLKCMPNYNQVQHVLTYYCHMCARNKFEIYAIYTKSLWSYVDTVFGYMCDLWSQYSFNHATRNTACIFDIHQWANLTTTLYISSICTSSIVYIHPKVRLYILLCKYMD